MPLPAGEGRGPPGQVIRAQPDEFEQFDDLVARLAALLLRPMDVDALGDDVLDAHPGVERRVRILEHHLRPRAVLLDLAPAERQHVLALEPDDTGGGLDQPQDASRRRGLTGSRFADQADGFAPVDGETHLVEDTRGMASRPELLDEVLDLDHRIRHRNTPGSSASQPAKWQALGWVPFGGVSRAGASVRQMSRA